MSNQDDKGVVNIRFTSRLQLLRSAPMNSWIAISKDESHIIAVGKTFMEADEIARQTGESGYFLTKTPDAWLPRCRAREFTKPAEYEKITSSHSEQRDSCAVPRPEYSNI